MNNLSNQSIAIAVALLVLLGAGGFMLSRRPAPVPTAPSRTATTRTTTASPPASPQPTPPAGDAQQPLRTLDRPILARLDQPIADDHAENALPNEPFKLDLYRAGGHLNVKLDLDRDNHIDESWTVDDERAGRVVRRVVLAADHDPAHEVVYLLQGETWARQ